MVVAFWPFGCEGRDPLLRVGAHGPAVNQYSGHHIVLGDCAQRIWHDGEPAIPLEMDLAAGSGHMRGNRVGRNYPVSGALEFFLSGQPLECGGTGRGDPGIRVDIPEDAFSNSSSLDPASEHCCFRASVAAPLYSILVRTRAVGIPPFRYRSLLFEQYPMGA